MKIDSGVKSVGTSTAANNRPATAGSAQPRQPEPIEAARVDISSLSAWLQAVAAGMGTEAPVDAGRVAEIRQAIADGRFTVNPERIADGLLQSVREMLGQRR